MGGADTHGVIGHRRFWELTVNNRVDLQTRLTSVVGIDEGLSK